MLNPLLTDFLLPPFSKIKSEHIVPAMEKILINCRSIIDRSLKNNVKFYTWENLCQPLAEANDKLERIFSIINHLNSVKNNPEIRKAYEKSIILISEYNTWVGQNKKLYEAYKNIRYNEYYNSLNVAKKKIINNTLRDFELSGIKLSKEKQQYYSKIIIRLSKLSNQYNNNILDSTMGWTKLVTDKNQLSGIPESYLTLAKDQAISRSENGWLFTLDIPSYISIMNYCDNQSLRQEIYYAYNTRASDQGPNANKWDNSKIMEEIIKLRYELAKLLGFESYAHKSLITKMIKNTNQVISFLNNLANKVYKQGKKDLENLHIFVKEKFNLDNIQPWDIAYYSEKQKQYLYNFNSEQIRSYFPENKVINGLFEIMKRIYGFYAKERKNIDLWHKDVKFFDLYDEKNVIYGSFYLDLYIRENKRSGAWMDSCIDRMRKSNGYLQKPVAYLICNFNPPVGNKPAMFTHEEVITLFHEFGHVLHHLLTNIEDVGVSGINGVSWDAIELPSQLMENWCWEPEALNLISEHYETKEPLKKNLLDKMLATKNFQAAMFILRQIELSLFDFYLHLNFNLEKGARILETLENIKKKIALISTPSWSRFPHTFNHIFAGGYAAGYYSYLWSNVLSADVYSVFKRNGIFNRKVGKSFFDNVLSLGGSEEPIDLIQRFLEREPKIDSMLEQYGIKI